MARRHDIAQILKILACVVLVGGLVMQICMLAAISSRTKATAQVNANIKTLSADKDNYNVKLGAIISARTLRSAPWRWECSGRMTTSFA